MIYGILFFVVLLIFRFGFTYQEGLKRAQRLKNRRENIGQGQTNGSEEVLADALTVVTTSAGRLAVLADGIGKNQVGRLCANLAVETFSRTFQQYLAIKNPNYFLTRCFHNANLKIQKAAGESRGGASVLAVLLAGNSLTYGLAGNLKAAVYRNHELIALSAGHTIDVLARQAFEQGRITRAQTLKAMAGDQQWNYVGMDGFYKIEFPDQPVQLKSGDLVLLMTKGIYDVVPWAVLEDILAEPDLSPKEKTEKIVMQADQIQGMVKASGSLIILGTDGWI